MRGPASLYELCQQEVTNQLSAETVLPTLYCAQLTGDVALRSEAERLILQNFPALDELGIFADVAPGRMLRALLDNLLRRCAAASQPATRKPLAATSQDSTTTSPHPRCAAAHIEASCGRLPPAHVLRERQLFHQRRKPSGSRDARRESPDAAIRRDHVNSTGGGHGGDDGHDADGEADGKGAELHWALEGGSSDSSSSSGDGTSASDSDIE